MISHIDYLIWILRDDNGNVFMQPDVGYDTYFSMTVLVQREDDIARLVVAMLRGVVESPAFNEEEYIKERREELCKKADEQFTAIGVIA